jgi:hypothetical protein
MTPTANPLHRLILLVVITIAASVGASGQVAMPDPRMDFIIGPQTAIGTSWFDKTEIDRAKFWGAQCPDKPPTDAEALNTFILLNYYDLPLTEYIAYKRSGDPLLLTYARKCADAWWQQPQWIGSGTIKLWPDQASPPPRHAGIAGLMLRALDGRPEMWDWINGYTRFSLELWLKSRLTSPTLYYGVREGSFALHYAVLQAAVNPDATLRTQFLADAENIVVNYYGRLQQADGSWCWDDPDFVDPDGGQVRGVTQPFMIGLLLNAEVELHRLTTNATVKASIQSQLTKACVQLYTATYRRTEPTGLPNVNWRSFWYFYYGGTTINPTKYATGGGSYVAADMAANGSWIIANERQSISTIFDVYAYAYLITGDAKYKAMGDELVDAAFVGTDGFRGFAADTAKNYNENYRMGGRYWGWLAQVGATPTPTPTPTPNPSPTPSPTPTATPIATPTPSPTPMLPRVVVRTLTTTNTTKQEQQINVIEQNEGLKLIGCYSTTCYFQRRP